MSAEARPISAAQFALAIQDLPVENIYSKAHEIQNSIGHLRQSNAQLQEYSDSIKNDTTLDENTRSGGDRDCLEAISENEIVIQKQLERIKLLKEEVERRGGRWHEGGPVPTSGTNGTNGTTEQLGNGRAPETAPSTRSGLTDEELRRRLEQQLGDEDDDEGASDNRDFTKGLTA